ncbi:MAG: class I SAM-dependent methyltransferase [Candidatus Aminicenantes bacterium]|nr:class I SAM-dependent methyltransferase [Candidatus Aminicenantes bacterium]
MDIRQAYNIWSNAYDTNNNKTRDLEAISLRATLKNIQFDSCLEIGCGTGKNTEWLLTKANQITAVDLSEEMLAMAVEKIRSEKVIFHQADITKKWGFAIKQYDLVIFSLVLEHIEDLDDIFRQAAKSTAQNGYVYIGELHPYKQYAGSKARFQTASGQQVLTCFNHNVSDFAQSAKQNGFSIVDINEYFDDDDRNNIPRILTLLLRKQ